MIERKDSISFIEFIRGKYKLEEPEYDEIEIFKDGWQRIELPTPPREDREIDAVISAVEYSTERQKQDRLNL